jgi:hypothetical protein
MLVSRSDNQLEGLGRVEGARLAFAHINRVTKRGLPANACHSPNNSEGPMNIESGQ